MSYFYEGSNCCAIFSLTHIMPFSESMYNEIFFLIAISFLVKFEIVFPVLFEFFIYISS